MRPFRFRRQEAAEATAARVERCHRRLAAMQLDVRSAGLAELDADVVAVALVDGAGLPAELADVPGAADARSGYRKVAVLHPERPARVLVVGVGKRDDLTDERLRVAAALVAK